MKSFFVGLLVIAITAVFSVLGVLILPFLFVLGLFLRWILGVALLIFAIWLIGRITLFLLEYLRKREAR